MISKQGWINLYKPKNITSFKAINSIKKKFSIRKIGHAGTLDPMATGILIACVGQMTRFSDYLANLPKSYEAEILLGQQTNTGDIEGKVIERTNFIPSKNELEKILNCFIGEIDQVPPIYSAE